jgi:hypothetical protein
MVRRAECLRFDGWAQPSALQSLIRPYKGCGSPGQASWAWRRIDSLHIVLTVYLEDDFWFVDCRGCSRQFPEDENGVSNSAQLVSRVCFFIARGLRIDQAKHRTTLYRLTIRKTTSMSTTSNGRICEKVAISISE